MNITLVKLSAVKNVFQKNKVALAFIFGSVAKGKTSRLSDLDFAVVLDKSVPLREYHQVRLSLADQLGRIIKSKPLDVAILNNASPLLAQLVITQGKLIFCQDENLRVAFQRKTLKNFDDAFYLRKTYYRYLARRVAENKLGEIYER
jgi:predicted nucleotidyltransferase